MSESAATGQRMRGQCLCGAVQFEVDVPERQYSVCHCGMCRRWSGRTADVRPLPRAQYRVAERQGPDLVPGERRGLSAGFCSRCGSSLFWRLAQQPEGMLIVSVDCLENADGFTLDRHIYSDAKPNRYEFADDRPRVTEAEVLKELGLG